MRLLTLVFLLVLQSFTINVYAQIDQDDIYKFNQVLENINDHYVDSVDISGLVETAIKASLKELDPHCVYYPKEKVDEINRGLIGSYKGIGITYDIIKDTVFVISVTKSGPSENAGLIPGDRIIEVDGEIIAGKGVTDKKLKDLLQGESGTEVSVTVLRKKSKRLKTFTIIRSDIPISSIVSAYKIDDIAYIKLNRFSSTTIYDFKKATDTLLNNRNKLILDLRNNSGGYLYVSVKLLEFFLERNTEVLTTKGFHKPLKKYYTQSSSKYPNIQLVVLINEHSASASEIFAGAVQDWDRGVILGRRSFGKGLVQKPIYLVDGSMLRLTIAKYYTPSGRNIQKPYINGSDEYRDEVDNRMISGELMNEDSVKYIDSLRFYTLINKREIFGGGGIMPDVFVPVDTTIFPNYIRKQVNSGKLNEFIHVYTDKQRDLFSEQFPTFDLYKNQYKVGYGFVKEMIEYLFDDNENAITIQEYVLKNTYLLSYFKALIADDLFGDNAYYQVFNHVDESFIKACELLKDDKAYFQILDNTIVGERDPVVKTPK